MMKRLASFGLRAAVAACLSLAAFSWATAAAAGPECEFGHGAPCASSDDCAGNSAATLCASDTGQDTICQVPCIEGSRIEPSSCSLGETCVAGVEPGLGGGDTFYCKASKLSMDLNMLDACVFHFLEGLAPDVSGTNECSLVTNLNQMLDQDGNKAFNIYDVDQCVRSFLQEEPCNTVTQSCPDEQTYCATDADCGAGLHCDLDLNKCTRQCGLIVDREGLSINNVLDRECAGSLKACDYDTGRCLHADLSDAYCQVDRDCPSGAYCFLGACQPRCYRSLDCPSSDWYCNGSNQCVPRPKDPEAEAFNPKEYSVLMAQTEINLDPIQNQYEIPLLIMDLVTKAQVFDKPNAVFGYRLELTDYRKMDEQCRRDPATMSPEEKADCIIAPDEEFITLESPFGTIYGTGDPTIAISINSGISANLTPGLYQTTLTAIFSNGGRTSATIQYRHPSPSGEYVGQVSVYADGSTNLLGTTNLAMRLYVDQDDSHLIAWNALLTENHIEQDGDIVDVTVGYPVTGYVHSSSSMMFNWPAATNDSENKIPVKGIYVPQSGRMRLLGVVDYEPGFCRSDNPANADALEVCNAFGRKVRRAMEFIGPFDPVTNRFSGVYRETYWGLAPYTFTLDGGFILNQQGQDASPITLGPLLPEVLPPEESTVRFPEVSKLLTALELEITQNCPAEATIQFHGAASYSADAQAEAFHNYLAAFDSQGGPIFEDLVQFEEMIQNALDALDTGEPRDGALTLDDFMKGQITFCENGETNCVSKEELQCGLALYRKAWLSGWIGTSEPTCASDSDCDQGEVCDSGRCRESCATDADCGEEEVCASGQCLLSCAAAPGSGAQMDQTKCPTSEKCALFAGAFVCVSAGGVANLFCKDIPGRELPTGPSDCPLKANQAPVVVALQDHNRFYRALTQTHGYEAGAASRDAFLTLYRAANGDPMDEASAYAQKEKYLLDAMANYDAIQKVNFSAASTKMLFDWPVNAFATRGLVWLKQMHVTTRDRMETLLELVDHRRRVMKSSGQQDYLFAKHVLHQEYLQQVMLMELQRHWEQYSFAYAGQSQELMQLGDQLLAKSKDNRNPLGLHPNRIYFENADLASMNWQNFRNRLAAEMPALQADVHEAVDNLKGSLASQDAFKGSLLSQTQQIEATIEEYCGSNTPLPSECNVPMEEKQLQSGCTGSECLFEYQCDDPECASVINAFNDGTSDGEVACRADTNTYKIMIGTTERLCVRGRVGALMQERVSLEQQREQIVKNVQSLVRQIARQQQYIAQSQSQNDALLDYLETRFQEILAAEMAVMAANSALELGKATGESLDCIVIVGTASGTNCQGALMGVGVTTAAIVAHESAVVGIKTAEMFAQHAKETELLEHSQDGELMSMRMTLDNLVTDVENHIASYSAVTQQLFNVNVQIDDARFQAQSAANRHSQTVGMLVDTLVGRESGSVLVSNRKVQDANDRFRRMLIEAYKMTRAFVHRFNLDNQSETWSNRVYQIVTIQDLEEFIAFLDNVEKNYCGAEGLDCDYVNNGEVFELSVQKQLFPGLHDIVDPNSGKVLTVGQQFHNVITSSAYMKRRARPYGLVSQIEIPLAIWLNDRGAAGGAPQRYMVGPGDCNHVIRGNGASGGTVAVNVIGTRIPQSPGVKYELWRGNTDYVRSCTEKVSSYESKINTYIVGWTPSSSLGQLDNPPSFFTQSGELAACINNQLLGNPATVDSQSSCFRFFARDRSLGAPDYQVVIPQVDGNQSWLLGDGLPANEKPIIEDIVLYFRYNDRPITVQ